MQRSGAGVPTNMGCPNEWGLGFRVQGLGFRAKGRGPYVHRLAEEAIAFRCVQMDMHILYIHRHMQGYMHILICMPVFRCARTRIE